LCPAGQQLEEERERALTHEAAAEQLQQRIASLQELRRQQQDMYGQQVNALLTQIREAQEQVAQAAELRRKAEEKCTTARKCGLRYT
jgi:ABC-type phosphate transport system auxiliary subunit